MSEIQRFGWRGGEIIFSQCIACQNKNKTSGCKAFPKAIPIAILTRKHDHRKAYPGDKGIRFKAVRKPGLLELLKRKAGN